MLIKVYLKYTNCPHTHNLCTISIEKTLSMNIRETLNYWVCNLCEKIVKPKKVNEPITNINNNLCYR